MKFQLEKPLEQMTLEEREEVGRKMLREVKEFYGNWSEVIGVIAILQDADEDKAFERSQNKF